MAGFQEYVGKYATKVVGIVIFILYFIWLFIVSKNDKKSISGNNVALYLIGIFIPLLAFCVFLFTTIKDPKYLGLLAFIGAIVIFLSFQSFVPSLGNIFLALTSFFIDLTPLPSLSREYSFLVILTCKLLLLFIIMVGLSIVYNVFLNEGYRQPGTVGFLMYFLFYIPCLINDYFAYLFQEISETPIVVYVLIVLELVLIFAYFILPKLLSTIVFTPGKVLITTPTYFYNEQIVSDISPFYAKNTYNAYENTYDASGNVVISRVYAISMWITTNNPTYGKDDSMMFRFGSSTNKSVGCPYISCTKTGKWRFVVSNNEGNKKQVTTEIDVPMQRWNYVVLNYQNTYVDIFINGELQETIQLDKKVLPDYTDKSMNVCVGSDSESLHGAICNVTVYSQILSKSQILQTYNILRLQNPPLNNVG